MIVPEPLKLGGAPRRQHIKRLNRLPIVLVIALVVGFFGVIIYGLSTRGLNFGSREENQVTSHPAVTDADRLKRGIPDAIIGEPSSAPLQPDNGVPTRPQVEPDRHSTPRVTLAPETGPEPQDNWHERLEREQAEQVLRELHRQRMASLQSDAAAMDAPISVSIGDYNKEREAGGTAVQAGVNDELLSAGAAPPEQPSDANGQARKLSFFNSDLSSDGYLSASPATRNSRFVLRRGSVIPATLISGINSDLPGVITAQVSQNVYDSLSGQQLLIPQGAKLLGRYDSGISHGQKRVLTVWCDVVLPDGSSIQLAGMGGTDSAGYGGFRDKVNNHYLQTFGAALLVGLIGTGTDLILPRDRDRFGTLKSTEDAARRSFAESFGKVAEKTVSRGLDVQPTLEIRPGYNFNIVIDRDIVFHQAHRQL